MRSRRRILAILALSLLVACGGAGAPLESATPRPAPAGPNVLLATTTSTQDSGLLDVLVPDFERTTGYKVKATAVGTGAALALGAAGDADVLLVHAPAQEREFMATGAGERRLLVMHNDFVLVGPPEDPAGIKGRSALDALRAIAAAKSSFISRGDRSGTDTLEKTLWKQTGLVPAAPWYIESGTGMGQTLRVASEKSAYTITDRATYLANRAGLVLAVLAERDPALLNVYHVITVSAARFPKVNAEGANALAEYLVSAEAQRLIAEFGREKFGEPLFFPDAGKREEDLGR